MPTALRPHFRATTGVGIPRRGAFRGTLSSTRRRPRVTPERVDSSVLASRATAGAGGDFEARDPAGRATTSWRRDTREVDAATRQNPCDDAVRVPHFASAEFVTTPHGSRYGRENIKNSSRDDRVFGQPHGTRNGLMDVGDRSVEPTPDLVTEDPEVSGPSHSNRASRDDPPELAAEIGNRRLLDHVATVRNIDLQRRVVEVAALSPLKRRRNHLEDRAADPSRVRASAQRDPEEVHGSPRPARLVSKGRSRRLITHHERRQPSANGSCAHRLPDRQRDRMLRRLRDNHPGERQRHPD